MIHVDMAKKLSNDEIAELLQSYVSNIEELDTENDLNIEIGMV